MSFFSLLFADLKFLAGANFISFVKYLVVTPALAVTFLLYKLGVHSPFAAVGGYLDGLVQKAEDRKRAPRGPGGGGSTGDQRNTEER